MWNVLYMTKSRINFPNPRIKIPPTASDVLVMPYIGLKS